MLTEFIKTDPDNIDMELIARAADCICRGGLVVFPTETVYGLGADAFNFDSVGKIFQAKGRAADNPLIAHVSDIEQVNELVRRVPEKARILMERFWGGPLTLILERKPTVPDVVTAGLNTVAVRMPSHSVAHELIRAAKCPIAAPSANISGSPSPTTAQDCLRDLDGRVDMIIDAGASPIGLESTVLDMTAEVPVILRPGAVTPEMLRDVLGDVRFGEESSDIPKCPGMKYTHYSPAAEVIAVRDIRSFTATASLGDTDAVISFSRDRTEQNFFDAGEDCASYAARLFYLLRRCDDSGMKRIYAYLPPSRGIGAALRNRLLKSSGGRVI
ncbi:MAG: L-threonylcarbamoyladenylate synthase [Clostridia bacterium]|nr:L-threonylcarbamoyladenylate synthase [Clostridia bacterium]